MPSKNFENFKFSFFDTSFGAVHDGIDKNALLALKGDERKEAENLLLEAIKTSEDDRPLMGVGYLELKQASEIIKKRLDSGFKWNSNTVWAAWALWKIEKYPQAAEIIIKILNDKTYGEFTRLDAAVALHDFGTRKDVISALIVAFSDEQDASLVGRYALEAIGHLFSSDSQIRELVASVLDVKHQDRFKFRRNELQILKDVIRKRTKNLVL